MHLEFFECYGECEKVFADNFPVIEGLPFQVGVWNTSLRCASRCEHAMTMKTSGTLHQDVAYVLMIYLRVNNYQRMAVNEEKQTDPSMPHLLDTGSCAIAGGWMML